MAHGFWDDAVADLIDDESILEFRFPPADHPRERARLADVRHYVGTLFESWQSASAPEIYETQSPSHFIVHLRHSYGRTTFTDERRLHESEFVMHYVVDDGKVKLMSENFNPLQIYYALGVEFDGVRLMRDEGPPEPPLR